MAGISGRGDRAQVGSRGASPASNSELLEYINKCNRTIKLLQEELHTTSQIAIKLSHKYEAKRAERDRFADQLSAAIKKNEKQLSQLQALSTFISQQCGQGKKPETVAAVLAELSKAEAAGRKPTDQQPCTTELAVVAHPAAGISASPPEQPDTARKSPRVTIGGVPAITAATSTAVAAAPVSTQPPALPGAVDKAPAVTATAVVAPVPRPKGSSSPSNAIAAAEATSSSPRQATAAANSRPSSRAGEKHGASGSPKQSPVSTAAAAGKCPVAAMMDTGLSPQNRTGPQSARGTAQVEIASHLTAEVVTDFSSKSIACQQTVPAAAALEDQPVNSSPNQRHAQRPDKSSPVMSPGRASRGATNSNFPRAANTCSSLRCYADLSPSHRNPNDSGLQAAVPAAAAAPIPECTARGQVCVLPTNQELKGGGCLYKRAETVADRSRSSSHTSDQTSSDEASDGEHSDSNSSGEGTSSGSDDLLTAAALPGQSSQGVASFDSTPVAGGISSAMTESNHLPGRLAPSPTQVAARTGEAQSPSSGQHRSSRLSISSSSSSSSDDDDSTDEACGRPDHVAGSGAPAPAAQRSRHGGGPSFQLPTSLDSDSNDDSSSSTDCNGVATGDEGKGSSFAEQGDGCHGQGRTSSSNLSSRDHVGRAAQRSPCETSNTKQQQGRSSCRSPLLESPAGGQLSRPQSSVLAVNVCSDSNGTRGTSSLHSSLDAEVPIAELQQHSDVRRSNSFHSVSPRSGRSSHSSMYSACSRSTRASQGSLAAANSLLEPENLALLLEQTSSGLGQRMFSADGADGLKNDQQQQVVLSARWLGARLAAGNSSSGTSSCRSSRGSGTVATPGSIDDTRTGSATAKGSARSDEVPSGCSSKFLTARSRSSAAGAATSSTVPAASAAGTTNSFVIEGGSIFGFVGGALSSLQLAVVSAGTVRAAAAAVMGAVPNRRAATEGGSITKSSWLQAAVAADAGPKEAPAAPGVSSMEQQQPQQHQRGECGAVGPGDSGGFALAAGIGNVGSISSTATAAVRCRRSRGGRLPALTRCASSASSIPGEISEQQALDDAEAPGSSSSSRCGHGQADPAQVRQVERNITSSAAIAGAGGWPSPDTKGCPAWLQLAGEGTPTAPATCAPSTGQAFAFGAKPAVMVFGAQLQQQHLQAAIAPRHQGRNRRGSPGCSDSGDSSDACSEHSGGDDSDIAAESHQQPTNSTGASHFGRRHTSINMFDVLAGGSQSCHGSDTGKSQDSSSDSGSWEEATNSN